MIINECLIKKISLSCLVTLFFFVLFYPAIMLMVSRCIHPPVPIAVTWAVVFMSAILASLLASKNHVSFKFRKISFSWGVVWLIFLIGLVFIFFLRENFEIDDIFMPTDLVGMTERVRQGLVPVSFSSFPDFYANYHQSFVVFTGMIAQLTKITALHSILFTFPFLLCLVLINLYLVACTASNSMFQVLLLIVLFLGTSSFVSLWPWPIVVGSGAYQALMFLDIFFSNTLVLGTLDILMMALVLFKNKQSLPVISLLVLLFCLIPVNATFFVVAWVAMVFIFLIELWKCYERKESCRDMIIGLFFLFLIYFLARFMPSAFLKGSYYIPVVTHIKYYSPLFRAQDWTESWETLRLIGPWIFLLFYAVRLPFSRENPSWMSRFKQLSFFQVFFLFSIIFPWVISLENVARWDAIHKFSLVAMLGGFLFLIELVKEKRMTTGVFYTFFLISMISSVPNLYHFFTERLRMPAHAFWHSLPDQANTDILAYLHEQKTCLKLMPVYQVGGSEIATLASFNGNFVGNAFYPGFLVKISSVDWPSADRWLSAKQFDDYLNEPNRCQPLIVVARDKNNLFLQMLQQFKTQGLKTSVDSNHPLLFKNYVIYHYNYLGFSA